MDNWMMISNLEDLINFSRNVIYNNLGEYEETDSEEFFEKIKTMTQENKDELDRILPYKECEIIIKEFIIRKRNKNTKETALFMKESDYNKVLEELNQRMVSNIISTLVSKDVLDMAFDEEKNDFVFWVKQSGGHNN